MCSIGQGLVLRYFCNALYIQCLIGKALLLISCVHFKYIGFIGIAKVSIVIRCKLD